MSLPFVADLPYLSRMRAVIALFSLLFLVSCGTSSSSGGASSAEPSQSAEGSEEASATPSSPLAAGTEAPAFMLQDQSGRVRQLSEYRGHPVVLYFYPRDATPGCTAEACAFRDAWDRLQATGAVVVGISSDDVTSHARFHEEHSLPFEILSDTDTSVAARYGVPVRMGMTMRVTFLIDADGVIVRTYENVDPGVHADEVIDAIGTLTSVAAQ